MMIKSKHLMPGRLFAIFNNAKILSFGGFAEYDLSISGGNEFRF